MKIEIRAAYTDDADAVCKLLCRTISQCCTEDHRNDPSILAAWLGNKTPVTVAGWFRCSANLSLVALIDGTVAGIAILTRAGKIPLFYVSSEARFRGVGKALLQEVESRAAGIGLEALQVPSTLTARQFYERNGFQACSSAVSVFGTETISMSKMLPGADRKRCRCSAS
jgi:GNAT superfamily N-acetyltransferase